MSSLNMRYLSRYLRPAGEGEEGGEEGVHDGLCGSSVARMLGNCRAPGCEWAARVGGPRAVGVSACGVGYKYGYSPSSPQGTRRGVAHTAVYRWRGWRLGNSEGGLAGLDDARWRACGMEGGRRERGMCDGGYRSRRGTALLDSKSSNWTTTLGQRWNTACMNSSTCGPTRGVSLLRTRAPATAPRVAGGRARCARLAHACRSQARRWGLTVIFGGGGVRGGHTIS
jgi:hypothetical protein